MGDFARISWDNVTYSPSTVILQLHSFIMRAWTHQSTNRNKNHHTLWQSIDFWVLLLFITEIRKFLPIWTDLIHRCVCVVYMHRRKTCQVSSIRDFKDHMRCLVFFLGKDLVCAALIWAWDGPALAQSGMDHHSTCVD